MHLALTQEQEEFRLRVRRYFEGVMTPDIRDKQMRYDLDAETYKALIRRIGADGWLCVSWPQEYGGRDLSEVEQFLFYDETQRLGVPLPFLTTNTVGPTIMRFGTDAQKAEYLPKILRGEIHFSIGYSEPEAGTDLASLRTRAVRDGDSYVINGQKMWTSLVDRADFVWLAARTDPEAPRHRGISMFIVPTSAEGFSWTRVDTMGGGLTSATYYTDVRVPAENLVGGENEGWRLMTTQLNAERIALSPSGVVERRLTEVRRWAQNTKLADGRRVIDQEWVQLNLARVRAKLEFLRLLNWKVAWSASQGHLDPAEASAMKVFGSEFFIEAWRLLMEVVGRHGDPSDPDTARLARWLDVHAKRNLVLTFGGGVNEVMRELVATAGLGLPRVPR